LGNARAEEILVMKAERQAEEDALRPVEARVDDSIVRSQGHRERVGHDIVDRPVKPGEEFGGLMTGDGSEMPKPQGWASWAKSFVPGSGK
jgi:hypothetical protein